MSQKRFARVGELLPAVLKSIGLDRKLKQQEILTIWPEVVGADIAAKTQAVKVDKGVLFVRVDHSAWIQELHFLEKEILSKLKDRAPDIDIKRIRFGTGK
jgi:predicted nucleic acid-binding Zn ribbon protein